MLQFAAEVRRAGRLRGAAVNRKRMLPSLTLVVLLVASLLSGQTAGSGDASVTAVTGESWLRHLHKTFGETSMGKTADLGPTPPKAGEQMPPWQLDLTPGFASQNITLHGSDLYRLNCRGCHGERGEGAPPEINSIIGPVQATSVAAMTERMKKAGRDVHPSEIAAVAKESKTLLLQRLHSGGDRMPPPTLSEEEIRALVPYLEQLSDVPGAEKNQMAVKESYYRVGEHIVKSTCHICHSATGPNPSPQQMLDGEIPPLATLPARVSLADFVRKVTSGASITMGTQSVTYRGRMPVYHYLSQDEAAAAYLYLTHYPPHP
jgi:mono/diheme cytochrome c family protein